MRGRALLAAVLTVIAIRCVPGQPGVINVGAVVPPMPLKNTPEPYLPDPPAAPVFTATPTPTPTPTPTATRDSPAPLEPLPPVPDGSKVH
jgi:hypothetical protein